nr:uncharacterized protein LOC129475559 [Symphalangus syndactylus]
MRLASYTWQIHLHNSAQQLPLGRPSTKTRAVSSDATWRHKFDIHACPSTAQRMQAFCRPAPPQPVLLATQGEAKPLTHAHLSRPSPQQVAGRRNPREEVCKWIHCNQPSLNARRRTFQTASHSSSPAEEIIAAPSSESAEAHSSIHSTQVVEAAVLSLTEESEEEEKEAQPEPEQGTAAAAEKSKLAGAQGGEEKEGSGVGAGAPGSIQDENRQSIGGSNGSDEHSEDNKEPWQQELPLQDAVWGLEPGDAQQAFVHVFTPLQLQVQEGIFRRTQFPRDFLRFGFRTEEPTGGDIRGP